MSVAARHLSLRDIEGDKPKPALQRYPIDFFHMGLAEMQTPEGKLYLFVGINRTSNFAVSQLVDKADRRRPGSPRNNS